MMNTHPRLFQFGRTAEQIDAARTLIREFADGLPFRSARVEELVLDEDFHRRPLRPEDFSFITFGKAVMPETVARLPFLATQRLLLSINEAAVVRFPPRDNERVWAEFGGFYSPETRNLGERIRPFLEDFAFEFLSGNQTGHSTSTLIEALETTMMEEGRFWGQIFGRLVSRRYVEEGTRFALIQNWSLVTTKRLAFARAQASGFFDLAEPQDRPSLEGTIPGDDAIRELAARCDLLKREHSYWQFYLSTSMARCNLLHALARRPDRPLAFLGAAFDAEAHWLAFGCFIGQAREYLDLDGAGRNIDLEAALEDLRQRFRSTLNAVEVRFGPAGLAEVAKGLSASRTLGESARADLRAQLHWLSAVEEFRMFAKDIDRRINAECPDIDRETFVEPKEMCSTTHVHDDHRLVVIETGNMVFWGNLGMKLKLKPGEMVLVPEGRLHGSSIESDECTYHQPIIPEAWIQQLMSGSEVATAA